MMPNTLTTNGVTVKIVSQYNAAKSNPTKDFFVFQYLVSIHNERNTPVQLLYRNWTIYDGATVKYVEGEGVIGEQPTLYSGQHHEYSSWCPITKTIGKMSGFYTFLNIETEQLFDVQIPDFALVPPFINN